MRCPKCGFEDIPARSKFCPECGAGLHAGTGASTAITVSQQVSGGEKVTGLEVGEIQGNVTVVHGNMIQVSNPSPEVLSQLSEFSAISTAIAPKGSPLLAAGAGPDRLRAIEQNVQAILGHIKTAEQQGQRIESVRVGDVEVSRVDLLLKQAILLKAESDQMFLDAVERNKGKLDRTAARVQVDLNDLLTGFDEGAHQAKLEEALGLLKEANRLDPGNAEVLLHLAQVLDQLNPDDSRETQRVLSKAVNLLRPPKGERERFWLAQATFLLATVGENTHPGMLQDARQMFAKLGETSWVWHIDSLLGAGGVEAGGAEPVPGFAVSATREGAAQAGFDPVGQWQCATSDGLTIWSTYLPNGTCMGQLQPGVFGGPSQFLGQWAFDASSQLLQVQGLLDGSTPFYTVVTIQGAQQGRYFGLGSDGRQYVFTRVG